MQKHENNFAFIDGQNIYQTIRQEAWSLNWKKFRIYLKEKYSVQRAYIFLGYIDQNKKLYQFLRTCGFVLIFKEVILLKGKFKGNVDVEMAVQSLIEINRYHQAILVSNDGDFSYLVRYLVKQEKLRVVLGTEKRKTSFLLKKAASGKIRFLSKLKETLQ